MAHMDLHKVIQSSQEKHTESKSAACLGWKLGYPDLLAAQGRGQYWLERSMGVP